MSITNEQIYDALVHTRGNITKAARLLETRRATLKARIDQTPVLLDLIKEQKEALLDQAEENFSVAVERGDLGASKMILETVGRERGYVKRSEIGDPDGRAVGAGMIDELERLIARHAPA